MKKFENITLRVAYANVSQVSLILRATKLSKDLNP